MTDQTPEAQLQQQIADRDTRIKEIEVKRAGMEEELKNIVEGIAEINKKKLKWDSKISGLVEKFEGVRL